MPVTNDKEKALEHLQQCYDLGKQAIEDNTSFIMHVLTHRRGEEPGEIRGSVRGVSIRATSYLKLSFMASFVRRFSKKTDENEQFNEPL